MKKLLEKILESPSLNQAEAYHCMLQIGTNELSDAETVAIMTALQLRGLHLNELIGFRSALLELALPVRLETDESIDVCGTGGDGKNTFNISTATAFVLANMGYKVVKHGNYGVSSLCGSSNVLEYLGYRFVQDSTKLQRELDQNNLCFLHAPLFHPALKRVAPLRKALGITTFFNGMGPLVNPAHPTHQLTGTYSLELAKHYRHVLRYERKNFTVLYGTEGFDELTFIGSTRILGKFRDEQLEESPLRIPISLDEISGGTTVKTSAELLVQLLSGKGTSAQHAVVAGNVALALQTVAPKLSFQKAFEKAYDHLLSGSSIQTLQQLLA